MRILTVRQPWAWAIIHGGKDVENRVRNIAGDYRGPVAIHAGLAFDDSGLASRPLREAWVAAGGHAATGGWGNRHRGVIFGVVDLVGVHEGHNTERDRMRAVRSCYRAGKRFGPCSPWAQPDSWHLELANPRPLAEPIPFKGALGLRHLDEETASRVLNATIPI